MKTSFVLFTALFFAMTMWACDGDGTETDADVCCDSDVQPDGNDDGSEAVLATLTVESVPVSGASVEINGTPTGEVTPHSFEKAVDHYTIQLTLADYDAAPEEVDLPTEGTTVTIELFPSAEGDWDLTFHNTETGTEEYWSLHLDQSGELLTGYDESREYYGSISNSGEFSLFREGSVTVTMSGSRVNSSRLEGTWNSSTGSGGTWWADKK
jgi:hypothetical protein